MIQIVSSAPSPPAIAAVDRYIPLTVKWDIDPLESPLYLFVRDPEQGYVELKVHPGSGALMGFVVIDAPNETGRSIDDAPTGQDLESPVLDLNLWPWRTNPDYKEPSRRDIDAEAALSQTVSEGTMAIWFSTQPVKRFLQAGDVRVGVSLDGALVVIVATGLLNPSHVEGG